MIRMKLIRRNINPSETALMETLFHTANGYVGVRNCLEEGAPEGVATIRGMYINAYYDDKPIQYGEKLYGFPETQQTIVNVTDVQTVKLLLKDESFDPSAGILNAHDRELDMAAGEAVRRVHWRSGSGREIEITVRRMASFVQKELFLLQYEVKSIDYEGPLSFLSLQDANVTNYADPNDPRVAARPHVHLQIEHTWAEKDISLITCRTKASKLVMVSAVSHEISGSFDVKQNIIPGCVSTRYDCRIAPNQTVSLVKWCVFTDQRRHKDPVKAAVQIMQSVRETGIDVWRDTQKEYLRSFWANARVEIFGDNALQQCMDYSLYQLLQSAGRDDVSNVAAKGLSGEGYEGHYFWDTEIYIFPFFLLTDRELAKRLLKYRYGILDSAHAHARLMGHAKGALYPWRTITGTECSGYFPSGSAQYHLSGDVAHSFIQYYLATDDVAFMADMGAEVLVETARMWLDAGHMQDGAFRIDDVTGPDEYTCIVNNNYYTNAAARENLLYAAEVCRRLMREGLFEPLKKKLSVTDEELTSFKGAGECMYFPYDEKLGIPAQDDSFLMKKVLDITQIPKDHFPLLLHYHPLFLYRHQVCKQADTVLAHFLFEDLADEETMARSYDYYEKITTHDSSLSACVFSIMASRLNDMEKAEEYYRRTVFLDINNEHGNTKDGLHTANLGGAYLSIVAGFAGLRIKKDGLTLRPRIPVKWQGYRFRFMYLNSLIECAVEQGVCRLTLIQGPALMVHVHDRLISVDGTVAVSI
jgi:alpha,alpha-trehalose phosphorylase